jgi:hypothetical protein
MGWERGSQAVRSGTPAALWDDAVRALVMEIKRIAEMRVERHERTDPRGPAPLRGSFGQRRVRIAPFAGPDENGQMVLDRGIGQRQPALYAQFGLYA